MYKQETIAQRVKNIMTFNEDLKIIAGGVGASTGYGRLSRTYWVMLTGDRLTGDNTYIVRFDWGYDGCYIDSEDHDITGLIRESGEGDHEHDGKFYDFKESDIPKSILNMVAKLGYKDVYAYADQKQIEAIEAY